MKKPTVGQMIHAGVLVALVLVGWMFIRTIPEYKALNCTVQFSTGDKAFDAINEFGCIAHELQGRPSSVTLFAAQLNDLVGAVDSELEKKIAEAEAAPSRVDSHLVGTIGNLDMHARQMRGIYGPMLIEAHLTGVALPMIVNLKRLQLREEKLARKGITYLLR